MEVPKDIKTFELTTSILWIDSDGIIYSIPKKNVIPIDRSDEEIKKDMDKFRSIIGNEKVCLVIEANPKSKPARKEQRDFIASELESVTKAMAIIVSSPVSRMIANLFFGFKPPTYPVKMCADEKEASTWIKDYL